MSCTAKVDLNYAVCDCSRNSMLHVLGAKMWYNACVFSLGSYKYFSGACDSSPSPPPPPFFFKMGWTDCGTSFSCVTEFQYSDGCGRHLSLGSFCHLGSWILMQAVPMHSKSSVSENICDVNTTLYTQQ